MNAKDILEIIKGYECGEDCQQKTVITKIAFEVAAKQKEHDAQIATDLGSPEVADAIMASE